MIILYLKYAVGVGRAKLYLGGGANTWRQPWQRQQ